AEESQQRKIGRLDAEGEVGMREQRQIDRAPLEHPALRNREVIRELVETERRRLNEEQRTEQDETETDERVRVESIDRAPAVCCLLRAARLNPSRECERADERPCQQQRQHRPLRDAERAGEKADRAEER